MQVTSWSQIRDSKKFDLNIFDQPFCSSEQTRFKRFETIKKFQYPEFWETSSKFNEIGNILFISGPARNGNHLTMSMLDGHKDILQQPGEDFMLRELMSRAKEDERTLINNLKSKNNAQYLIEMSGATFDKWKRLNHIQVNNIKSNIWSGQQPENQSHVTDFQDVTPKINYNKYKEFILSQSSNIANCDKFLDIFAIYLKALQHLVDQEDKNLKYPYLWVYSGLRRELFYLFEKTNNIICLCPIREFDTFYYSYAKSRFNTTSIKQGILDELWEHWRHKTIDYLLLQKKYKNKLFFLKYEDLITYPKDTLKRVCSKLGVSYSEDLLVPTILGEKNKGNSSFAKDDTNIGKIYSPRSYKAKSFHDTVKLPNEYFEILDLIKTLKI